MIKLASPGVPAAKTRTPFPVASPVPLLLAVSAIYAAANFFYFSLNGWLATRGTDLWFYLAVANQQQPLSPLDVTYWIGLPLRHLSAHAGFLALVILAPLLNLLSTLLVYRYLGTLLNIQGAKRFLIALLFALLPHNLVLSIASFSHFTVAQPFLILAAGRLAPWCLAKTPKLDLLGIACLIEALIIGPEGWFLFFALTLSALSCRMEITNRFRIPPALLVLGACAVLALLLPYGIRIAGLLSMATRGIDIGRQRELMSADLLGLAPFSLSGIFVLFLGSLGLFALLKRRYLLAFLILASAVISFRVLRFSHALELVTFTGFAILFARGVIQPKQGPLLMGAAAALCLLMGFQALKASNFPPHLARLARDVGSKASQGQIIACSPAYGFLFQAHTRAGTTDDLHHPAGMWAKLAASTPREASRLMRQKNIGFLVLSSSDFGISAGGYWSSGGLNQSLADLDERDFKLSLVVRALTLDPPLVQPMKVFIVENDGPSRQQALALTPGN
jgi:hypothetical protein